ncbi:MAG TPA: hypothetical protein VIZ66_03255 [Sphingomicrobium sp.]
MSVPHIEQAVLKLLTSDSDDYDSFRSLTTIFESLAEPREKREALFDEFDPMDDDKEALRSVLDQMVLDGLLNAKMDERDYERSYRLTDQGAYEAAFEEPTLVTQLRPADAISTSTASEPTLIFHPSVQFSSVNWTGVEQRLQTSPDLVREIQVKVIEIDRLIEKTGLTNAEKDKAKAITEALLKLVHSPEPEWKIIAELLTSRPLTALVNVAAIAQIVLSLILGK